ncbi:MAG: hypothetical protein ACP5NZ_01685 [Nanobdellota archaeon]
MKRHEANKKIINFLKIHQWSLFSGVFLLFLDLPFWLVFVEGNRDYGPWARTVAVIIFAASIVLLFSSAIAYRKARDVKNI